MYLCYPASVEYSNKVNAEYEAIKKTILEQTSSLQRKKAQENASSVYDNIDAIDAKQPVKTEPVVYRFEDLGIYENTGSVVKRRQLSENTNSEIFEQILKQVDRATSQAEQLEKLDCEVSFSVLGREDNVGALVVGQEQAGFVDYSKTSEFIPFYQVSEELIIEESFNVKKSNRGIWHWLKDEACLVSWLRQSSRDINTHSFRDNII